MKYFSVGVISLGVFIISSCGNDTEKKVDVSEIKIPELTINRLDQDVFNIDTINFNEASKKLENKYGHFYNSFITGIVNNGGLHDSSYQFRIKQFIKDKDMRQAYNDCQQAFPNTNELNEQFLLSFKYFKNYYPTKNLPKIVVMMSGFNYNVINVDSTIGIGLEMYLGRKSKFYSMLALPLFKTNFMNKENILPDAVRAWMLSEFNYNMNKNDFLSQIIYMGKIMYATHKLLPEINDTLEMQYTSKQMDYCKQNEFNMWSYFIAQKILYTSDQAQIMKFTSDGPFTSAFSKNSAPRVGYWIGYQIVKQYMKNNSSESLEQLMNENDAQLLLNKAKYKPAK